MVNIQQNQTLPDNWDELQRLKKQIEQRIQELENKRLHHVLIEIKGLVESTTLQPQDVLRFLSDELGVKYNKQKGVKGRSTAKVNRRISPDFEVGAIYQDPSNPGCSYEGRETGRLPNWLIDLLDAGKTWEELKVTATEMTEAHSA